MIEFTNAMVNKKTENRTTSMSIVAAMFIMIELLMLLTNPALSCSLN